MLTVQAEVMDLHVESNDKTLRSSDELTTVAVCNVP